MKKEIQKKSNKGFTLIELIIGLALTVLGVLAVLACIALWIYIAAS